MRPQQRSSRAVVKQSTVISIAAAAAIVSGLLLDVSIAAKFGAGRGTDAFFVAARIPLGLVAIVMVGANQALVPAFSTAIVKRGEDAGWRLTSQLLGATLALSALLFVVMGALAQPLMRVTAPGLPASEIRLAASLMRVMILVAPLVAMAEVMRAALNARYAFAAPAAMNVVMNGLAAAIIVVVPGHRIHVVAWAYVLGAFAQLSFMVLMARRRGFRYEPRLDLQDEELRAAGRLTVRPLAGASLNPLARVGEQLFVSFLPPGSLTILNYGYRLISAIGGSVFFRSVIVALVPRLTEATAEGDRAEVEQVTRLGVRIMLALSIPLTPLMAILAKPAVLVVFRRGNFSRSATVLLGVVLAVYASSLVGSAVQRALLSPFFARLDTRVPLRNTVYGVAANLVLVPALVLPLGHHDRAIIGVALAYSVAQYVNVIHAWWRLRRDLGIRLLDIRATFVRLCVASAVLTPALLLADRRWLGGHLGRAVLLARTAAVAIAGCALLLVVVVASGGSEALRATTSTLRRRRQPAPVD